MRWFFLITQVLNEAFLEMYYGRHLLYSSYLSPSPSMLFPPCPPPHKVAGQRLYDQADLSVFSFHAINYSLSLSLFIAARLRPGFVVSRGCGGFALFVLSEVGNAL